MTTEQSEQLNITSDEFLDKLEAFLRATVGKNWNFDYRGQEDNALDFRSFWVWGLKSECIDGEER